MKSFMVICLSLLGLSAARKVLYPRGCIYDNGRCSEECPVGTQAAALGCCAPGCYMTLEPTCKQPNPVAEEHMLCDFSTCYCDPPTVRDEVSGKCVLKEQCSEDTKPATTLLPPFKIPKPEGSDVKSEPEAPNESPPESAAPSAPVAPVVPVVPAALVTPTSDAPKPPDAGKSTNKKE